MKKFLRFLEKHTFKLMIIGVVIFIAALIIGNGSLSGTIGAVVFLGCAALVILGAIGLALRLWHKLKSGVKSVKNKVAAKFGKGASAKRSNKGDDIITLTSQNGEKIDFLEIAGIAYRGSFYAILQPCKLLEGMSDDEALVFKVTRNARGEDSFNIELDDNIIDAVFKEYNRLLDQQK